MINQRVINEKKKHREYLEVEATILYNTPQADPAKAKILADVMMADILRISADIKDLESGIEIEINEASFAQMVNKYYFLKLKSTDKTQTVKRLRILDAANFWGLLRRSLKGK